MGVANELVDHDRLLDAAREWATRIDALPSHVVPMMKPLLRNAAEMSWEQSIAMEEFAEPMTFTTRAPRGRGRVVDAKLKMAQSQFRGRC
jgi:2-(1,2-epoxy-1,2-dihydrophenyl)acetyl-CoA isomerase